MFFKHIINVTLDMTWLNNLGKNFELKNPRYLEKICGNNLTRQKFKLTKLTESEVRST